MLKVKSKIIMAVCFSILGNCTLAQNYIIPKNNDRGSGPGIPPGPMVTIPEEALIRYDRGEAPAFMGLTMYTSFLESIIETGNSRSAEAQATLVGLMPDKIEEYFNILNQYPSLQLDAGTEKAESICRPLLAGEALSNQTAKEAIADLASYEESDNQVLLSIVETVRTTYGNEVANRFQAVVGDYAKTINYTKIDEVKLIELTQGGDYLAYLTNHCNSI